MKRKLLDMLYFNGSRFHYTPSLLSTDSTLHDELTEGEILTDSGEMYPVSGGILRYLENAMRLKADDLSVEVTEQQREQIKTNETFSKKWGEFLPQPNENTFRYMMDFVIKRMVPLGIRSEDDFIRFLQSKKMILDAGSGMGWMSAYMAKHTCASKSSDGQMVDETQVVSVEIADGVKEVYKKCKEYYNCNVIQADITALPFRENTFDYIHSDGVLHHTPNAKLAMKSLYNKLAPGGIFWFYIYKEMNPVKHFCDDYIRGTFSKMNPEQAFEVCKSLTELGRELSKIDTPITLEKPIPILNIPAGTFSVQRFLYYNFVKCFWNDDLGYDVSNVVNFDWYHPNNASQQTVEEVEGWMREYNIKNYEIYSTNPNGMNVIITKA